MTSFDIFKEECKRRKLCIPDEFCGYLNSPIRCKEENCKSFKELKDMILMEYGYAQ